MKESDFDLQKQNSCIESKIIASLERISQAFKVLLWNESKELSLTPIQIQVIIFLLYHPAQKRKVSYLANEFNITKATMSDTVKALEQKTLIIKAYEQNDTRSYIIHLTKKGKALARQTSLFTQQIHIPLIKLPALDKENLLLSLFDIIHHLNKTGVITIQRMCFTCQYYNHVKNGHRHFCELLNTKLEENELRIDCAEHKEKILIA